MKEEKEMGGGEMMLKAFGGGGSLPQSILIFLKSKINTAGEVSAKY